MLNRAVRRRRGERGQALLLAIGFIAFFGLLSTSVLTYAGVTGLQQVNTEKTAGRDELAEGGAALALADASRNAAGNVPCTPGGQGTRTMRSGDTVSYVIGTCDPRPVANPATAGNCVLCLLSAQTALTTNANLVVGGAVAINGSASVTGSLTSDRAIGCAILVACTGTFLPPAQVIAPIADPLAGIPALPRVDPQAPPPPPIPSPNFSEDCTSVAPTAADLRSGAYTLASGSYCAVDFSTPGQYQLSGGIYAIGGPFVVGSGAKVTATGPLMLYFNCSDQVQDSLIACGDNGANVSGGLYVATGGTVTSLSPLTTGPYAGITVMFDRANSGANNGDGNGNNLCNNADVGMCIRGTVSLQGTVYSAAAPLLIQGAGKLAITAATRPGAFPGRLVASSLTISVNAGFGLNLTDAGTSPLCWVYGLSDVNGTTAQAGFAPQGQGHAVLESGCNGNTRMISFDYANP